MLDILTNKVLGKHFVKEQKNDTTKLLRQNTLKKIDQIPITTFTLNEGDNGTHGHMNKDW